MIRQSRGTCFRLMRTHAARQFDSCNADNEIDASAVLLDKSAGAVDVYRSVAWLASITVRSVSHNNVSHDAEVFGRHPL